MRDVQESIGMDAHGEFHFFRDFMLHFIPLVLVAIIAVVVGLGTQKYLRTERLKMRERNIISQEKRVIQTDLAIHAMDALLVADICRTEYPLCADPKLRQSLFKGLLKSLSRVRQVYDQVRFLDDSGREIVRVNRKQDLSRVVGTDNLQDKSSRPYFVEAIHAPHGEVIVSPFDLNIEHGELERPIKPMIRFSTPVDDPMGKRMGVVVLNYLGRKLIDTIRELAVSGEGDIYLANKEGYWLIGPTPEMEWGFMLGNETTGHLRHRFPELWDRIGQQQEGQVILDKTLFTFARMTPVPDSSYSQGSYPRLKESEYWVLISSVPLHVMGHEYAMIGIPLGVIAFIGLGIVAWMWTSARYREHLAVARLVYSATRDGLTNLYNRAHFVRCVDREIERALRYDRSLSLILFDIDHFKKINDTYGHDRGDEVLRMLAVNVLENCRDQDVPGRVGGEEFAVLLPETDREQAAAMAERLRQSVEKLEVRLGLENVVRFTISVGVTAMDQDREGVTFQLLYTRADALMYRAKEGGRNRVVVG